MTVLIAMTVAQKRGSILPNLRHAKHVKRIEAAGAIESRLIGGVLERHARLTTGSPLTVHVGAESALHSGRRFASPNCKTSATASSVLK